MKILLCAINSKFIHTNPAIHCLKAYADARFEHCRPSNSGSNGDVNHTAMPCGKSDDALISIETAEYTINQPMDEILAGIYRQKPQVLCFSCYIWNISYTENLVQEIKKVLPSVPIFLGGPEVSFDAENVMTRLPEVAGVMRGEGEATFYELCCVLLSCGQESNNLPDVIHAKLPAANLDHSDTTLHSIAGLTFRNQDGIICSNPDQAILPMNELPFIYHENDDLAHRIIYYESSRGCPFNCSYCLSSVDKHLRFRSLEKVLPELQYFLDQNIPQVKFVDRTFNCKKGHAMAIWQYLLDHDNGITNFHFEVAADLITEDELKLLSRMRPGQVQLEIGIQSTNPATISEIHRTMDFQKVADVVTRIHSFGNIHQHVDLIAGLPCEDLAAFRRSFNDVYALQGALLQLGFLKVLKGSFMAANQESYNLVCQSRPPYEVLCTRWLSYDDVLVLKGIEEMVEVYYNSLQFTTTLPLLEPLFETPYDLFDALRLFYERNGLFGISHKRSARYEHLLTFAESMAAQHRPDETASENHNNVIECTVSDNTGSVCNIRSAKRPGSEKYHFLQMIREALTVDYYLRENAKSRPTFAIPEIEDHGLIHAFYENESLMVKYLPDYLSYDSKQRRKMTHLEYLSTEGTYRLFDYAKKDPLTGNARCCYLTNLT